MFFFTDESGHTGANLFDENQPILYYGVLASKLNLDVLAEKRLAKLRKKLKVDRLHANVLGNGGIVEIIDDLLKIHKEFKIKFDIFSIVKADHALISFFDQVFDQGLNPAVTWTAYWTPLRYMLLLKLSYLFEEETLKKAWEARIERNDSKSEKLLSEICETLKNRVDIFPDERSRVLIFDILDWAQKNPSRIYYNTKSKKDILSITPNLIGFQLVMFNISERLLKFSKKASKITVDQQSQFNKAQKTLADFYASAKDVPIEIGLCLPKISLKGMPTIPISFQSSTNSAGLELVDIYLWIFKRFIEKKELAPEIFPFIHKQRHSVKSAEVSIKAISSRWQKWFSDMPEPTEEQMIKGEELKKKDEQRRIDGMKKNLRSRSS